MGHCGVSLALLRPAPHLAEAMAQLRASIAKPSMNAMLKQAPESKAVIVRQ